ncbi:MAG: hypothetical protein GY780_08400 [bacterium]|nr:hypothetical protein [bacterium]
MKKIAFALLLTLLVAGNAFAQLDPDDDGIGVYFDPCACVNCLELPAGEHLGYLVITHPTSEDGVLGWEATVWNEGPGVVTEWELLGDAINVATRENEFIVGLGSPEINPYTYPAVVVAVMHLFIFDESAPVEFFIDGVYFNSIPGGEQPNYLDGADYEIIKPLQQIQGSADLPVAIINGDCDGVVATENTTFDGLKALYR